MEAGREGVSSRKGSWGAGSTELLWGQTNDAGENEQKKVKTLITLIGCQDYRKQKVLGSVLI